MVQRQLIYIVVLLAFTVSLKAQEERSFIRKGNQYFTDSNFIMADSMYAKAVEINPNSIEAQYNIANSFYEQKNYEEAITGLENTIPQIDSNDQKAKAYHNLGNAYMETKKLEAAIEAYKNALRNNPADTEARYNLAYAQSMIRKNDNNKSEDNKDKDQDKKEKDKKEDEKDKKENKDDKDGKNKDSKENPEEQKKKQDEEKKNPDKKGDQPDDEGEKDKSKEGKEEKDNQKGEEKGEENKDSEEKKGKEDDGEPGGKEGKESKEETDKKGQGAGEKDDNQPQKVKAISKAKANELLKELENDEKHIREKMIRMKMKQRPRKNIDKDW